jgi:hypothetical protein
MAYSTTHSEQRRDAAIDINLDCLDYAYNLRCITANLGVATSNAREHEP